MNDSSRDDFTTGAATRELYALVDEWIAAEVSRDVTALRRILHDGFICTFGAGKPLDKKEFIAAIVGDGSGTMESMEESDRSLVIDGDTAVAVETSTVRGTRNGQPYANVLRVTATYIRRDGRWLALAEHLAWPTG